MSNTYRLVCDDCKAKKWVGQNNYLYDGNDVESFLYNHVNCNIRFICNEADETRTDYEEIVTEDEKELEEMSLEQIEAHISRCEHTLAYNTDKQLVKQAEKDIRKLIKRKFDIIGRD